MDSSEEKLYRGDFSQTEILVYYIVNKIQWEGLVLNTYEVTFIREGVSLRVTEGTTILEAEQLAGLHPNAPCGGKGTCGKCVVTVRDAEGSRQVRACGTNITRDLKVDTLGAEQGHSILTQGLGRKIPLDPVLRVGTVKIPKLSLGQCLSQWERLQNALEETFGEPMEHLAFDPVLASSLYEKCKEGDTWQVILGKNRILSMTREPVLCCAAAFDIGTTTVVGYLLDAQTGKELATESRINPQAQYGADVILRVNDALEHGTEALSTCIRRCMQEILQALAADAGIQTEDIYEICAVGNTCMHHLLLGLLPASLAYAPYNPVVRQLLVLPAQQLGLSIHPGGELLLLPNIAGFVGADTLGCLLCTRPDLDDEISLMIDIGTNGEMVLGSKDGLVACSTAAGPAFEGARIQCGMRGAQGAVDHVSYENGIWHYTTVGNAKAVGICGSGLIDLAACLRKAGLLDESGYLALPGNRFVLVSAEDSGRGEPVYISQKDVREVQLAKAAIGAGIRLLEKALHVEESQIRRVYIAGAFGNYMDPASACAIGMIPRSLLDKIRPIGNAAGEGAKLALLSRSTLDTAQALSEKISFVELAASPEFQDCFVDELEFPEAGGEG